MKTWLTIVAVLALAAAAYEWPTSKTVPVSSSWRAPSGESGIKYGPGGAKTIQFENKGTFAVTEGGGGGGGASGNTNYFLRADGVWAQPGNNITTGVNEKGTRFTYSPDGGTIYVQK